MLFYNLDLEDTQTEILDNSPAHLDVKETSIRQSGRSAGTSKVKKLKKKLKVLLKF